MSDDGKDDISGNGPRAHAARGHGSGGDDVVAPLARHLLWVDSPSAVQRLILGLAGLCAVLFVFDIFWHRHAYVPGEGLWGYHAIVGFVSFTLIVLGAKALRTVIRRDEDYYAPAAIDAEPYPPAGLARRRADEGEEADELLLVRDGQVVGKRGRGATLDVARGDIVGADAVDGATAKAAGYAGTGEGGS